MSKRFWTRYKHAAKDFIQHFCHSSVLHFPPPPPCLNEPKVSGWISVAQQSLSKKQWNSTLWETGFPPGGLWLCNELSQRLRTTRKLLILTLFSTATIWQPFPSTALPAHTSIQERTSEQTNDRCLSATKCLTVLQRGVQCLGLDRPAQLLLQQPVTGRRVQCRKQDCS